MKHPYFERYELHRKKFAPGTVWVDKEMHTVRKLQIISLNEVNPLENVYRLFQGDNNIFFRVTESHSRSVDLLGVGKIVSWSAEYMENNYRPVLEPSL